MDGSKIAKRQIRLGQLLSHGGKAIKIPKIWVLDFYYRDQKCRNSNRAAVCKPEPEDNSTNSQTEQFQYLHEHHGKHSHINNFWLQVCNKDYNLNDVKIAFINYIETEKENYPLYQESGSNLSTTTIKTIKLQQSRQGRVTYLPRRSTKRYKNCFDG